MVLLKSLTDIKARSKVSPSDSTQSSSSQTAVTAHALCAPRPTVISRVNAIFLGTDDDSLCLLLTQGKQLTASHIGPVCHPATPPYFLLLHLLVFCFVLFLVFILAVPLLSPEAGLWNNGDRGHHSFFQLVSEFRGQSRTFYHEKKTAFDSG